MKKNLEKNHYGSATMNKKDFEELLQDGERAVYQQLEEFPDAAVPVSADLAEYMELDAMAQEASPEELVAHDGSVAEAGAKWDGVAKSWYASAGADMDALQKWLLDKQPLPDPADKGLSPEEEFGQALEEAGLDLRGSPPVMDGELHRVPLLDGNQGKKDGAYHGYLDGRPAGFIENHKTGQRRNWKYTGHELSSEEKARLTAQAAAKKEQRAQEQAQDYAKAAQKAAYIFENSKPAYHVVKEMGCPVPSHQYLFTKDIRRATPMEGIGITDKGDLVIPACDVNGTVKTLQFISPEGEKRFLPGGQKSGNFHTIGKIESSSKEPLLLAEGFATAASIHEATGLSCLACFDAGNLEPVAKALAEKYPDRDIVICADNDHTAVKNVGVEKAQKAAKAVGGHVIAPQFDKIFPKVGKKVPLSSEETKDMSDFNDLAKATILGELDVRRQIESGLKKIRSSSQDQGR